MIRLLILTDHITHTEHNSVYGLAKALLEHPEIIRLSIASRGCLENRSFFEGETDAGLWAIEHNGDFKFPADQRFESQANQVNLQEYDFIFLRIPRPIHPDFFAGLTRSFPESRIINKPSGIIKTGNKSYLLNFPEFTAPIQLLTTIEEIEIMANRFSIVLKPLEEYGGKGIIRINGNEVETEGVLYTFDQFRKIYSSDQKPYLGMQFLRNVKNGDKRIVVAGGEVLSASLRLPAEDSWLCNIAQGGSSVDSTPDDAELEIIAHVDPVLRREGIFYYGLDTLENDEGLRVISELNTLSIGGIITPAHAQGENVAGHFVRLMVQYMNDINEESTYS